MAWSHYWGALSPRQRVSLLLGAASIVIASIAATVWLLRDPYVPLASGLSAERVNALVLELERVKLRYRVAERGDSVLVQRSELGKASALAAAGTADAVPSVGLELFKEADYSTTDFVQKVNYQRALQGEITRTLQTIDGVRSARVHVILPDGGLFKRTAAKASAAITVAMQPGVGLSRAQVLGIQRLVAASVPEMKIEDVVVLDDSGASLARAAGEAAGDLSSAQFDLKRQADQYLEGKVLRLLHELVPQGIVSLAVDATLDEKQARVTTEEPIGARGSKDKTHAAGVLVKERQSQRGLATGLVNTDGYAPESDRSEWELEYKVGNRVEQTLTAPGAIKRVSVAVAVQGAPAELSSAAIEELVGHAVGIDRARGDSVGVLLLARSTASDTGDRATASSVQAEQLDVEIDAQHTPATSATDTGVTMTVLAVIALSALLFAVFVWRTQVSASRRRAAPEANEDDMLARIRQWLKEGTIDERS
jgi:flagellar M-ring protein FliF